MYDAPPNNYNRIQTPAVVVASLQVPEVIFGGGHISATYTFSVDWLFGAHEASGFEASLQALPMMIEDLATDEQLTTICTGNLTVTGADPAVGIFAFDGKNFIACARARQLRLR